MSRFEFDPTLLHNFYFEDILINLRDSIQTRMPYNWMEKFARYQIADDLLFICTKFKINSPDVRFNALWICLQYLEFKRKLKLKIVNRFPIMYISVAISIKYYLTTVLSFEDIIRHLNHLGDEGWTKESLLALELDIMECLDYKMRTPHLWSFVYVMLSCFMNPLSFRLESTNDFVQACQDAAEMIILRSDIFHDMNISTIVATVVSCGNMLYYHKYHNAKIKQRNSNIVSIWISSIAKMPLEETISNGKKLYELFNKSHKIMNPQNTNISKNVSKEVEVSSGQDRKILSEIKLSNNSVIQQVKSNCSSSSSQKRPLVSEKLADSQQKKLGNLNLQYDSMCSLPNEC